MFAMGGSYGGYGGAPGFNTNADGPMFTFEALTGMRAWKIGRDGDLESPVQTFTWNATENTAKCPKALGPIVHPCPTRECSAGFYAYHSEDYWFTNDRAKTSYPAHHPWVNGVIAGWGRVVNGPKGFRCAKAVVLALAMPIQQPDQWASLAWIKDGSYSWEAWEEHALNGLRSRFPNVPFYPSVDAMLEAIPLTPREAA